MPPEDRRAAIIEATLPLLEEYGPGLTTRQIAEASGVAEGTIFRVFTSLQELIGATIRERFSLDRAEAHLVSIDLGQDLLSKTRNTLDLFTHHMTSIRTLLMAIGHAHGKPELCIHEMVQGHREHLEAWLAERFAEHADELRVPARDYVSFLRLLASGRILSHEDDTDPDTIISLALDGARRKDNP